jgi:zinc transport system ATP-binding protein
MADTAGALIEGSGLCLTRGGRDIVQGVDIAVHGGEIVTLIGPNGAGKSTLARLLLGLIEPDAGTVRRKSDMTVGYLPQRTAIDPVFPLTVRRLLDLARKRDEATVRQRLEEVGASLLLDAMVHELSGGELQRVMLARALLRDPDLLVLDEPVQGVDFTGEIELYELIAEIRDRRGCGVLLISHDLHLVMAATDRVVCLNHHICCAGQPEAVSRDPEYLALFGPKAARRLAIYAHAHDHHHDISGGVVDHDHGQGHDHP